MYKLQFKSILVLLLVFTILNLQLLPCLADTRKNQNRVAFVGIKLKDIPQDIQDILLWRMITILESNESIVLAKPDAVQIAYGRENMNYLLDRQDADSFRNFAKLYGFDYVFSAHLENQAVASNQVFLTGELIRYDSARGKINKFPISEPYDKFGNSLVQFKKQYVDSIKKDKELGLDPWPIALVGGLAIVGIIAVTSGALGFGGDIGGGSVDAK